MMYKGAVNNLQGEDFMLKKIFFLWLSYIILTLPIVADTRIPIEITKIYDGDTVEAKIDNNNPFKIRLIGIDCYETSKIHRAYKQAYCNQKTIEDVVQLGLNSKEYLKNLYNQNKNRDIFLEFKGIDIYGRALGILYFDSLNVNERLKNAGGCLVY